LQLEVILAAASRIRNPFDVLNTDVVLELVSKLVGPCPVNRTEMALVSEVLDDLFRVRLDVDENRTPIGPAFTAVFGDVGDLPEINPLCSWTGLFFTQARGGIRLA